MENKKSGRSVYTSLVFWFTLVGFIALRFAWGFETALFETSAHSKLFAGETTGLVEQEQDEQEQFKVVMLFGTGHLEFQIRERFECDWHLSLLKHSIHKTRTTAAPYFILHRSLII